MAYEADEGELNAAGLFDDPEGYYPPTPPPTKQSYLLRTGQSLTLHLVGQHNLWAHHLWNGGRYVAAWFEAHPDLVKDRAVLELGAGAGLPSLVAAVLGAHKVVMTDYDSRDLLENMRKNIAEAGPILAKQGWPAGECIVAEPFVWGRDVTALLGHLGDDGKVKFDVLVLADLLFNHPQHGNMLKSVAETMRRRRESMALVFFSSYRPWLQGADMAFFDLARERGFVVEKVLEEKMEKPMFEDDPGDVEVQKTVQGFVVRWPEGEWDE